MEKIGKILVVIAILAVTMLAQPVTVA